MPRSRNHILRKYRISRGLSCEEFAKKVGVAIPTMRSLENGTRAVTAERAKEIEEATEGEITRADLRPDIFDQVAA